MKRILAAAGVMLALLAGSGCIQQSEMQTAGSAEKGPVLIGAILPMTGRYQQEGFRMLNGLQFAEHELNNRRGINGRPVKLIVFDSESSAAGAVRACHAAAEEKVSGIVAGYSPQETEAIIPAVEQYRIPTILPTTTSDDAVSKTPYLVRNTCTDSQQAESLAAYLWHWRQMVRICVLIDMTPDEKGDRDTVRAAASAFKELGGTITNTPQYTGNDYEKAVSDALISAPQAIVISAGASRAAEMIKAIRAKGYTGTICGFNSWDSPDFFRAVSKIGEPGDCIYVSLFDPQCRSDEFQDFRTGFRKKYFHDPGSCETMSYDALKLLVIGLGDASSGSQFRRNWLGIRSHFGAAATYTMLKKGGIDRTIFIHAVEAKRPGRTSASGRLIRSFMHSKLAEYRY